jgi:hypothetical protein
VTPIADIVREVHSQKQVPIEKINLLLSTNVPLDLDRIFEHYNCPKEIYLATELWFKYETEDGKEYFFDPNNSTTHWELPAWAQAVPGPVGEDAELATLMKPGAKHAKYSHLLSPSDWLQGKNYLKRPARKQIEKPYIKEFAYKQGDEEYNIWFDKYLNDYIVRQRTPASTRCDPEKDIGYTKADLFEPETSYWCLHFVRGCCAEGANCSFFHHLPSLQECKKIAPIKDIFGRSRHATQRDDMGGIGCFQKECKTIVVGDLKIPPGTDPVEQLNEMLWRHFSLWGKIEDIMLIPAKCLAFIRFYHRCYAEIAKEAMSNQSLDFDEMISIKWTNEDPNPNKESLYSENWHRKQLQVERENRGKKNMKNNEKNKNQNDVQQKEEKIDFNLPKKLPPPVNVADLDKKLKAEAKEKQEIRNNLKKMESILQRIESEQTETLAEIIFPACLEDLQNK